MAVPDGKQPYAIARTDGAPLAVAGVWESWRDPAGEVLRTFTIVTTAASEDMAQLHSRMLGSPGDHWRCRENGSFAGQNFALSVSQS